MATENKTQWEHPQYIVTAPAVKRMRDSVAGEDVVKSRTTAYLPNPCTDPDKQQEPAEKIRYENFIAYAEYENIPGNTLDTLVGAMFRVAPTIEVDSIDPELLNNADGNGIGLDDSLELTAAECLQMRYHGLLVEYSDLAGEDPSDITVQDARDRNLRATIKHYQREDIVNWSYRVVNGTKQLNMVILREQELQAFSPSDITSTGVSQNIVKSYLVLALDENDEYVQRRYIESGKPGAEGEWSGDVYPQANGSNLNYIPFEIVFSTERKVGDIPKQLGYIDPISVKAIHRYQVSALLKEALRITAQPTSYSKGWTAQYFEQYKEATGREYISLGAGDHIPLFGPDAEVGYLEWNADSNGLFKYMENNKDEIISVGGVFSDESDSAATATGASINSAEKKGVLSTLAKNMEESYRRVLGWVAEFNGTSAENAGIKLSREFVAVTLSPQDRMSILNEVREGLITRAEALKQLERGGVLTRTAEELLNELEDFGEV